MGHKRLLRMSSPATTDRVRLHIISSRLEPTLAELGLFKKAELLSPPTIADRDANGMVAITGGSGLKIVYTTDGSMPTVKSDIYRPHRSIEWWHD